MRPTLLLVLSLAFAGVGRADDFGDEFSRAQSEDYRLDDPVSVQKAIAKYVDVIKRHPDHPRVNAARIQLVRLLRNATSPALQLQAHDVMTEAINHAEDKETAQEFIDFHVSYMRHDVARDLPRAAGLAARLANEARDGSRPLDELEALLLLGKVRREQKDGPGAVSTLFGALDRAMEMARSRAFDRDPRKKQSATRYGYELQTVVGNIAASIGGLPEVLGDGRLARTIRAEARKRPDSLYDTSETILKMLDDFDRQRRSVEDSSFPLVLGISLGVGVPIAIVATVRYVRHKRGG